MTVLIKGMELPTDPLYPIHVTIYADGTVITGHGVGEFAKEAVPVPTPHGRLVDADELAKYCERQVVDEFALPKIELFLSKKYVDDAPTVIEAEEEEA